MTAIRQVLGSVGKVIQDAIMYEDGQTLHLLLGDTRHGAITNTLIISASSNTLEIGIFESELLPENSKVYVYPQGTDGLSKPA